MSMLLWTSALASVEPLAELIRQQQYAQAWGLAQQLEDEHAGEPDFDFYFALAALEAGYPQAAVFALERLLAVIPGDQRARLELARAYFMLGNYGPARHLFQQVLESQPPPRVQQNIRRFLAQINQRTRQREYQWSSKLALSLGYDSNVNSATDEKQVSLPIGLSLQLDDSSRELADDFLELSLDTRYLRLQRKDRGYFLAASLLQRSNLKYAEFDVRTTTLEGGYVYQSGRHRLRLPLQYQYLQIDEARFRDSPSIGMEWTSRWWGAQWLAFAQLARQNHVASEKIRDVDSRLLGLGYSQAFAAGGFKLSVSLYQGLERSRRQAGEHFGRQYLGWRLAGQWALEAGHEVQLNYVGQQVEYAAVHPAFAVLREDDFSQIGIAWGWSQGPLRLGLALNYIGSQSNIGIYSYKRVQQFFSMRYRFDA